MNKIKFISIAMFILALVVGAFISTKDVLAVASPALLAKDFTVWSQGGVIGYDAGFSLTGNAIFNNAQSIVIKLYSGNTLLQTNTALKGKITGTEFITPFDVFGTFNYTKDGYFTNKKEIEYGRILAPTKVVANVILADGKVLTTIDAQLIGNTKAIGVTPIGKVLGAGTFNFTSKMKNGSISNEVMELQKFLNNNGYDCGTSDGKFGAKTKLAVIEFQIANGLEGDGVIGSLTRGILNK